MDWPMGFGAALPTTAGDTTKQVRLFLQLLDNENRWNGFGSTNPPHVFSFLYCHFIEIDRVGRRSELQRCTKESREESRSSGQTCRAETTTTRWYDYRCRDGGNCRYGNKRQWQLHCTGIGTIHCHCIFHHDFTDSYRQAECCTPRLD